MRDFLTREKSRRERDGTLVGILCLSHLTSLKRSKCHVTP